MIVPMKKVSVLVLDSRRDRELARLKRLGVLHPEIDQRKSDETEALSAHRDAILRAVRELPADDEIAQKPLPATAEDTLEIGLSRAAEIHRLAEERRAATEHRGALCRERERVNPWGAFSPRGIAELAERGIELHLFSMSAKDFRRTAPQGAIVLEDTGKTVRFALIWKGESGSPESTPEDIADRPEVEEFVPPELSPEEIDAEIAATEARLRSIDTAIDDLAPYRALLGAAVRIVENRLEHEHVRLGMDAEESVAFITGYVPADAETTLRNAASENGWGLLFREPTEDDEVPTKIANPRWIRTIKPVFDLLGVIPGYRERDISVWFLLFFTVFVGMIIGDAGYGTLLVLAALLGIVSARRKGKRVSEAIVLLTVLGMSTLGWGAITGNWFGFEPIGGMRPFSYLVIPVMNSFDPRSTQAVQSVCFILAAAQLSIAHVWNFVREVRRRPAIKAIAQLGWLSALLGLYFLVVSLFLGEAMPQYALTMIVGGMAAVFVFSGQSPDRGFFGGVARGMSNAFTIVFDGIGAFSDIISYIRLFAVGLASVAIAQAFNEMAASVSGSPVGYVLAVVILLFGHSLNLIMGGLAVVVHGVRLNLLEFSGHLGMEWTGVAYRPFAENKENT